MLVSPQVEPLPGRATISVAGTTSIGEAIVAEFQFRTCLTVATGCSSTDTGAVRVAGTAGIGKAIVTELKEWLQDPIAAASLTLACAEQPLPSSTALPSSHVSAHSRIPSPQTLSAREQSPKQPSHASVFPSSQNSSSGQSVPITTQTAAVPAAEQSALQLPHASV